MTFVDVMFVVTMCVIWTAIWLANKAQQGAKEASKSVSLICDSLRGLRPGNAMKWTLNGEDGGEFASLRYEDLELLCDKAGFRLGSASKQQFEWKPKESA